MKVHIKRVQVGGMWVWRAKSENIEAWCDTAARAWQEWRKAVQAQVWLMTMGVSSAKASQEEIVLAHRMVRK